MASSLTMLLWVIGGIFLYALVAASISFLWFLFSEWLLKRRYRKEKDVGRNIRDWPTGSEESQRRSDEASNNDANEQSNGVSLPPIANPGVYRPLSTLHSVRDTKKELNF